MAVIAFMRPISSYTEPQTEKCLRALKVRLPGVNGIHMFDLVGQEVAKARNMLTEEALKVPEITHFMWIDHDMTFKPDALERLLRADKPIVGGLCFSRHVPYHPILCRKMPDWVERDSPFNFVYYYPPDDLFEVDATGAAFLLVKREVFDKMTERYGKEWWSRLPGMAAEDFSFMIRAKELGYSIYVDTGCKIGHIGKVTIDEEMAGRMRQFEWEPWIPEVSAETLAQGAAAASVIIPTYNQRPEYLRAAVMSALHQSVPTEVIVVDDGSSPPVDPTAWPKHVQAKVKVLRHEHNRGVSAALNTGIEAMTTPWFCWLSSDDLFMPRKVETQLGALKQARMKASFHRYQAVGDSDWALYTNICMWRSIPEQMAVLAQACAINGSTVMLHRSVFDDVGRFDESQRYGQDYEMWCRIGEKYLFYPIDQILGTRRECKGNLTDEVYSDPEKKRIRDAEDEIIRRRYARWAP